MKNKNLIYCFISSVFFFSFLLSALFCLTLDKPKYIFNKIDENKIYSQLSESIKEEMHNYIYQSGFQEDILDNLFTEDMVRKDFNKMITSIYENKTFILDTTILENNLNNNIELFLKTNNISEYNQESLDSFKKEIINAYQSNIDLSSYSNILSKLIIFLHNIAIVLMVISCFGACFFYYILKEDRTKGISISFLFSSMAFLGLHYFISGSINITSFHFFSVCISDVLSIFLTSMVHQLAFLSILLFILGILLCFTDKKIKLNGGEKNN